MIDYKQAVLTVHQDAQCWMNPDNGTYRIVRPEGEAWISLSAAWDTQTMAWHEAALLLPKED